MDLTTRAETVKLTIRAVTSRPPLSSIPVKLFLSDVQGKPNMRYVQYKHRIRYHSLKSDIQCRDRKYAPFHEPGELVSGSKEAEVYPAQKCTEVSGDRERSA